MKRVAVFGATGSVGTQTMDIIRAHPNELSVCCVSANANADGLNSLIEEFVPQIAALADADAASALRGARHVFSGQDALQRAMLASKPDLAVIAVSGMAGLPLLAECLEHDIPVALANKESIVAGASVVSGLRARSQSTLVPLDSEHAAIYQCLGDTTEPHAVRRFWITASGGPFLRWDRGRLAHVTAQDALKHPTWNMGRKITIDSASLANKGLEVIEAHYLFDMPTEQIEVIVQPDSLVHSMVEFTDGSTMAQFAAPDMHVPIRRALLGQGADDTVGKPPLDFRTISGITFEKPDTERFPCLSLAYEAADADATAVYNAANEVAALAFADGLLPFTDIPHLIEDALGRFSGPAPGSIPEILDLDAQVRQYVRARVPHLETEE